MNMHKLCTLIEDELHKIADKGLTSSNLETTYKLLDMLKDIKTIEAMDDEYGSEEYEDEYSQSYNDGGLPYGSGRGRMGTDGRSGNMYSRNYDRESSYARGGRRRRDSRGRYMSGYSRDDGMGGYAEAKQRYRQSKDSGAKSEMLEKLEEYMDAFSAELAEMSRDADCAEERQTIQRYVDKIRQMM